jgi:Outer membrane protein beta-barrel domain
MKRTFYATCAVALIAVSAAAIAADPLGLYLGGSLGNADVRSTYPDAPLASAGTDPGWKIFIGARPISFVGIELAYMDFGHATVPLPPPNFAVFYTGANSRQRAATAFGVGYLPLPVPFLDLYGKAGIARLETRDQVEGALGFANGAFNVSQTYWSSDFAYGVGLQARFGQFALRAEYERINASGGDPSLSSVGALWRF